MAIRAAGFSGLILVLSACGGGNSNTSGSTTGSAATTGGTAGNLAAGAPCAGDAQCASGVCGVDGSGNCCGAACVTGDAGCGATACDATGACLYPDKVASCGSPSCSVGQLTISTCDGKGTCDARQPQACPANLACKDATTCQTSCSGASDCANGFYCNSGTCVAAEATGACTENDACTSGVCGISGTGSCCTSACAKTADPACDATACDASTGACVYASTAFCAGTCTGSTLNAGACDATGTCGAPTTVACPGNLVCNTAGTNCLTSCAQLSDCATGYYCNADAGACAQIQSTGPCGTNDACTSGICGISGAGHCCTTTCSTDDPACGATDCDSTGACVFPSNKTTCGDGGQSCSAGIETNLPLCDGAGTCQAATTSSCGAFICGANACITKCAAATSCVSGGFCDDDALIKNAACCTGLTSGVTIEVDSSKGNDKTACCGFGGAIACKTVTHAMALIDDAQATGVTIHASLKGAGGNWGGEPAYPVILGWGAELSAPGVYFYDVNQQGNTALFEIRSYSKNDTVGYASIVGSAGSPVGIGMDLANSVQTSAGSAITVDDGSTLYIADAVANTSAADAFATGTGSAAIFVEPGATLVLGQDQSGSTLGTVTLGNALGQEATDGWVGLFCASDLDAGLGCTVTDSTIPDGGSSLVVQGQEDFDIAVTDLGSMVLTSNPIIGVPPTKTGFGNCPSKTDGSAQVAQTAVIVQGGSTFKMTSGVVQCISGAGIVGSFDDTTFSTLGPTITLDGITVQNTDFGLASVGGTMAVTNSTIRFNFMGIQQLDDVDGLGNGSIDLSGGGNTVVCSSQTEDSFQPQTAPGLAIYNLSLGPLDADNVAWDTAGPDYFDCDNALTTCTCNQTTCSLAAGSDGMSAVEDSTELGGISVKNPTLSSISCN